MTTPSGHEVMIITGSSGLIGSALVRRLAGRFRVIGFDCAGDPHPPREAECVYADVTCEESIRAALARVRFAYGGRIASVVHLAAHSDLSSAPSPLYEEITVRGTERLLRCLAGFEVEQFVFCSTMFVHAPCKPGQRIDEAWPLDPRWEYPKSKAATEELLWRMRDILPVVVLRIADVYDDVGHSILLTYQICQLHQRRLSGCLCPTDGDDAQTFLHLDDLAEAIERIVGRRGDLPAPVALLLGEPETLSYEALLHEINWTLRGRELETWKVPKPLAKIGAWLAEVVPYLNDEIFPPVWLVDRATECYALSINRTRALLGWEPKRSLRKTLPKIIAALKADPLAWYRANRCTQQDVRSRPKPQPQEFPRQEAARPLRENHRIGDGRCRRARAADRTVVEMAGRRD